jgi:5'(3')-deoxyribonucleotidase
MKKRPNILLDMDGVLSDFLKSALRLLPKKNGSFYTAQDYAQDYGKWWGSDKHYGYTVNDVFKLIEKKENFWFDLDPFPWAKDLYKYLSSIGDVTIVTTPIEDPDCARQKLAWLKYHLGITSKDVIIGGKKYLLAGNGILIDDWSNNVDKFKEAGGKAILVPSNWNSVLLNLEMVISEINPLLKQYMYEN